MTRGMLWVCALALLVGLPGAARAARVARRVQDGRVDVVARDAHLREILVEWSARPAPGIVNRDRVPGTRLNLELKGVPEDQALATPASVPLPATLASRRLGPTAAPSAFSPRRAHDGGGYPRLVRGRRAGGRRRGGRHGDTAGPRADSRSAGPGLQRRMLPTVGWSP